MTISLQHNKGFIWHSNNTTYFKGYFYVDDCFYEKENALNFLSSFKNNQDLKTLLQKINGVFTILKKEKDNLFIASDVTRSFPVFYTYYENNWLISDNIIFMKNKLDKIIFDDLSELELKASNHVHGFKTLLKNVYQTQSSEYLLLSKKDIKERDFYFSYSISKESTSFDNELKKQAIIAFDNSFQRFIDSLENKTVVIPLSGGFDSRLIAVMLKKHNYKNVVCFTYGRKDSFEIENSKKTAKELNFEWHFIEYTNELISDFLSIDHFKNYAHFAGKLSSMPNLQEYFAVKYLKENSLISKNSIFVPGYAGDILGGSEYLKTIPNDIDNTKISKSIVEKKMINYRFSKEEKSQIKAEVLKNLFLFDNNYKEKIPETVFDDYNLKERIAKYIFNSANFYSFFDYEFRFPFWDKALLEFFKEIPIRFKRSKTLFDDVLINEYFKPFNVNFENEIQPTSKKIQSQKIKDKIKPILPTFIKQKFLQKNDWNNYEPITNQMLQQMKNKGLKVEISAKNYNEIIIQWYLYFSKNNIK